MKQILVYFLLFISGSHQSSVMLSDNLEESDNYITVLSEKDIQDSGKPLFLTPLIEKNEIEKARNLSRINGLDGVQSHSGFFTVNKRLKTNLYFWFIKANSLNWENLPVLLWLQGGPGLTSLYAAFIENGPFELKRENNDRLKLVKRPLAWTNEYNVIYIDSPAGTGFSHTGSERGYSKNQKQVANNLYVALTQFFKLFPSLQKNNFTITGESYAGKYIPALGYKIHFKNKKSKNKINLTGLFIGNAFVSPVDQLIYGDYLHMIGLIDENQQRIFNNRQKEVKSLIEKKEWLNATEKFSELFFKSIYKHPTLYNNFTGFTQHYNYLKDSEYGSSDDLIGYLTQAETRKMMHVGDVPWGDYATVVHHLKEDIMKSVKPWVEVLLEHYDILFYNGQFDVICAYPTTTRFFQQLKWSAAKNYFGSERVKWYVDKKLAGYYKKAGKLIEVLVRNSGHMVPSDSPSWTLTLLKQFLSNKL